MLKFARSQVTEQAGGCRSAFLISKAFLAVLDNPAIATAISYPVAPVVLAWNFENSVPVKLYLPWLMAVVIPEFVGYQICRRKKSR